MRRNILIIGLLTLLLTVSACSSKNNINGNVVADNSKYSQVTETALNQAIGEDKIVVLNFFATWCPSCTAEQPAIRQALESFNNDNVKVFQVNYKDSDTDDFETELAKKYGITVQGTKIILKDGEQVSKIPQHWQADKWTEELNKL